MATLNERYEIVDEKWMEIIWRTKITRALKDFLFYP